MGREANCVCNWNGAPAQVKALLEPPDLILRREIRRRMPFSQLRRVRADRGALRFTFGEDDVALNLGVTIAEKWAKAILALPPSLATKLGITAESIVWQIGEVDDAALEKAIGEAGAVGRKGANIILARVNTPAELSRALKSAEKQPSDGVPIWIVYRKGPGHLINESDVRGAGLGVGIVDVKVASVSAQLTALKFMKRRNPKPLNRG